MIDTTYLKAYRVVSSLTVEGDLRCLIGRGDSDKNTKLHALTDAKGRPLRSFLTAGQISEYLSAADLLD